VISVPFDSSDGELAGAMRTVLAASQSGIPTPSSYEGLLTPVLERAGVRSERAFNKNARAVQITEKADGSVEYLPMKRDGAGWTFMPEVAATVSGATDEVLAEQLRHALEASVPRP
jgi:hypothetical protein